MRPVGGVDNSALLVGQNVKVIVGAQHSTFPLSLHDLLHEGFIINLELYCACSHGGGKFA